MVSRSVIKIIFPVFFLLMHLGYAQSTVKTEQVVSLNQPIDFTVTDQGMIYVIEGSTSEINKYSADGLKLKQCGGFGWNDGLFDAPVALFNNLISVFVTDKNNHRIQQFDKDLNFVGSLVTNPQNQPNMTEIRYPIDCFVASQGDYFILDSENKRIVKFDPFGNFEIEFGGYNWGAFALETPRRFIPGNNDYLAVLEEGKALFYSYFGTGIRAIPVPEGTISAYIAHDKLYCAGGRKITIRNLENTSLGPETIQLDLPDDILKVEYKNNSLYVLTGTGIYRANL